MGWRRFFYSTANLLGLLAAIAVLGLYLAGILRAPNWMVWGMVAGAYVGTLVLVVTLTPPPPMTLPENLKTQQALEWLREHALPRLPPDTQPALQRILDKAQQMLPRIKELEVAGDVAPEARHLIKQTLLKHLPTSIESYLRLPPMYARMKKQGKSPHDLLLQHFELMHNAMDELEDKLYAGDLQQMQVQSRLLEQQFGEKLTF